MNALHAALDFVVIDLLGCALPRAYEVPIRSLSGAAPKEPLAAYRAYNGFDLFAGCGAGFLTNLCITIVVPIALSSIESRNHPSPLAGSGSVAATTSVGMVLSVALMMRWSEATTQGRKPFVVFASLLMLGNALFFLAEWMHWSFDVLLASRVLMSLGFGAGYVSKLRASGEPDPKRREYYFMRLELFNSLGTLPHARTPLSPLLPGAEAPAPATTISSPPSQRPVRAPSASMRHPPLRACAFHAYRRPTITGMASGPIFSGLLAVALPLGSSLWPPLVMSVLASAFLGVILLLPLTTQAWRCPVHPRLYAARPRAA